MHKMHNHLERFVRARRAVDRGGRGECCCRNRVCGCAGCALGGFRQRFQRVIGAHPSRGEDVREVVRQVVHEPPQGSVAVNRRARATIRAGGVLLLRPFGDRMTAPLSAPWSTFSSPITSAMTSTCCWRSLRRCRTPALCGMDTRGFCALRSCFAAVGNGNTCRRRTKGPVT
jgi:hypothetical protein